jgi:ribosomal peptide maturation radical SAM protein 1
MSKPVPVLFLNMPVVGVERPSLAIGILQALLRQSGISSTATYANIEFATRIGLANERIIEHRHIFMLGEWLFAGKAFDGFTGSDPEAYLHRVSGPASGLRPFDEADMIARVRWLREEAEAFVDELAERIVEREPRAVGCTSVFQQHVASLAVLRRIRELAPDIVTLLGGSNCETTMGKTTHECFDWVDYVVSGEADELIVPLVRGVLAAGRELDAASVPYGVFAPVHRAEGYPFTQLTADGVPRAVVERLARSPTPEYGDYFRDLEASGIADAVTPGLPFESSRGCWWGQKHLCSFCGLNGGGIRFRAKPWEAVLEELDELSARHGTTRFEAVDNIVSLEFFKTLLPALAARGAPYRIFFETKANLKRQHVQLFREAGVTMIQPGIESLNSKVLDLMSKGVSASLNLQLLKWCREFGIQTNWNLMYEFPGEEDAWYLELAEWLPLVWHLQPPVNFVKVQYHRYSAYHDDPAAYGLDLTPASQFYEVYPLDEQRLSELVYYFFDRSAPRPVRFLDLRLDRPGLTRTADEVKQWNGRFWGDERPVLTMVDDGNALELEDTRPVAVTRHTTLTGLARELYLECDEAHLRDALLVRLKRRGVKRRDAEAAIVDLVDRKLMLELEGNLISLAVRAPMHPITPARDMPFGRVDWPEPTPVTPLAAAAHAGAT